MRLQTPARSKGEAELAATRGETEGGGGGGGGRESGEPLAASAAFSIPFFISSSFLLTF